jgi:hypothetical protein
MMVSCAGYIYTFAFYAEAEKSMRWNMKSLSTAGLMAGTLLVMSSPFAHAQTQTFNISFDDNGGAAGFVDADFYNQTNPSGFFSRLIIPQFDPSQGTLTNVRISLQTQFFSQLLLTRVPPTGDVPGSATITANTTVNPTPTGFAYSGFTSGTFIIADGDPDTTLNLGSAAGPASAGLARNYSVAGFPAFDATFVGTGNNTNLVAQVTTASSINTTDATITSENTQAKLLGTVTYSYQIGAIPEPSSLLLLAPVMGGIALAVRTRKRKSAK